jgi:hypothetical protein
MGLLVYLLMIYNKVQPLTDQLPLKEEIPWRQQMKAAVTPTELT